MSISGSSIERTVALEVNGKPRRLPAGTSVTGLLESVDLLPGTVVVELNRTILRRPQYDEAILSDGDQIEIVHFVGGG